MAFLEKMENHGTFRKAIYFYRTCFSSFNSGRRGGERIRVRKPCRDREQHHRGSSQSSEPLIWSIIQQLRELKIFVLFEQLRHTWPNEPRDLVLSFVNLAIIMQISFNLLR